MEEQEQNGRRTAFFIVSVAVAIVSAVLIGLWVSGKNRLMTTFEKKGAISSASVSVPVNTPVEKAHASSALPPTLTPESAHWEEVVLSPKTEVFTVASRQMQTSTITVPPTWRNMRFQCHFEVQGGSGNDIEAFVTDADGLTNAQNGHSFGSYYNSGGKVTVGTIDIALNPGTYYLLFSNRFSTFSNKVVHANCGMRYEVLKTGS
jgi:hypothetical protein